MAAHTVREVLPGNVSPTPSKANTAAATQSVGDTVAATNGGSGSNGQPASSPPVMSGSILHSNIITTIFWVGEPADSDNGYISNVPSAWDEQWETHYGGEDAQTPRNGYYPAAFTPKENPFYFALPYDDLTDSGHRKSSANNCPNSSVASLAHYSWCKNAWISITANGKTAYAQWEDVGPYEEDDTAYVFGTAAPKNTHDAKAGLDVAPAVQTYLGLNDVSRTTWQFVPASAVPAGPWKSIVTINPGETVD